MRVIPVTHGMPCWFELTTRESKAAAVFYAALADASVQTIPMGDFDYTILMSGEHAIAGIMPMVGPQWPADLPSHWVIYFAVDDVDATLACALELGGRSCGPPMDIPIGRMAIVNDPSGAVFTLFRAAPGKTDGTNPMGDGAFVWCELGVDDPAAATAFYRSLFGWRATERRDDGFSYQELCSASGTPVASIFKGCNTPKPAWRPYLQVSDVASAFARATELGAKPEWQPMDVPRFGRFAGVTDPTGTPLTLLQPMTGWGS